MTEQTQAIVDATMDLALRPQKNDRQKVIAAALRELIKQYSYTHLYLDGDHGIGVVNVRDIMKVIQELEEVQ